VEEQQIVPGKQITRLRKARGLTQKELAKIMNIPWTLMTDYERGKLRLNDVILSKLSSALKVSTDEILGLKTETTPEEIPSLRLIKRMNRIEKLPHTKQKSLLQTIDGFLKGEEK